SVKNFLPFGSEAEKVTDCLFSLPKVLNPSDVLHTITTFACTLCPGRYIGLSVSINSSIGLDEE
ncbi:MAG: hypothetical protein JSW40_05310, partial [Candidatus Omnitrophota bacterium]